MGLEIVLLYISILVEHDQIAKFAEHLANIDKDIPITLLAFFPEYKLRYLNPPSREDMVKAYQILVEYGLRNVKIGNIGVICETKQCVDELIEQLGRKAIGL